MQSAELRRKQSHNKYSEPVQEPQENFFRSAFRALARPVRPRPKLEDLHTAYEMGERDMSELDSTEREIPVELDATQTYEIDGRDNDLYQSYLGTLQSTTSAVGSTQQTASDGPPHTPPPTTAGSSQAGLAAQTVFEMEGEGHHMMPYSLSLD